jgi:hypothetical protein
MVIKIHELSVLEVLNPVLDGGHLKGVRNILSDILVNIIISLL